METQSGSNKPFRWVTLPGIVVALATGLAAFFIVYLEITMPIPGLPVVTDPREVAVLFGAVASGPLVALIIGVLAGVAVADGNAVASMVAHSLGGALFSVIYRQLAIRLKKSTFRFMLSWVASVIGYFYLLLMPMFILTHNLYHPEKFAFGATYVTIARGAFGEVAVTVVVSTLIMLILPRRYRRPLWGN
jgi:hypothetical protein